MSQLDAIMAADGLPAILGVFGDPAVYTPQATGTAITTQAIPAHDMGFAGQYAERAEPRLALRFPRADIPEPQPGDSVLYKGTLYRVHQMIDRDGYLYSVAVS